MLYVINKLIIFLKKLKVSDKIFKYFFRFGVFFLVSAPLYSSIILLISAINGVFTKKESFLKDKWNLFIVITSFFMISSGIINYFYNPIGENIWDPNLNLLGFSNWLPLFFCFWGFQKFLSTKEERELIAKLLIAGSIPVIFSGFGQYFFNFNGPFTTMDKTITWFMRPIQEGAGMTGLFNNQNYASAWLSMCLPFSVATFIKLKDKSKKILILLITFLFLFAIFLTLSRGALLSILLSSLGLIYLQKKNSKQLIFLVLSLLLFIVLINISLFESNILSYHNQNYFNKFNLLEIPNFPRFEIWNQAISFISERPFWGWGAGTFQFLYEIEEGGKILHTHSHNLPFEIALNYGIISSLSISIFVYYLIIDSLSWIKKTVILKGYKSQFFNIAWIISLIIIAFSHLFDITYFDVRISVTSWILLAGAREIVKISKST